MSQTQVTINKKDSLQEERKELQLLDEEIHIMKEKVAKMKVLNQLELELATTALLRQQYRYHRVKAEKQMRDLDEKHRVTKNDATESNGDEDSSDDSMDSDNSDIK
ncbi:hypothetical protein MUCCIDRAFT_106342 [Mucor lusitanicus CBS 277.49]|uniref:Uncharacterized protein n=1 Tax=Mucor lusitanicus CBS 277.49 TaxID=747725 RepID=A0A168N4W2_MUCCL|nr:hypothetical protein MUCCIDRAFT_106342 [Mucor lusitanicus CBS 277.49]